MLQYNLKLALKSLGQRKAITVLIVITIGIGIGMLMTMVTIGYQIKKVPFGTLSDKLYYVQMDSRELAAREVSTPQQMVNLTYQDAINLFNADTPASRQTFNFKVFPILAAEDFDTRPIRARVDATTSSFFEVFPARFIYGKGWAANENGAPVIVLTKIANDQLFGGQNSVGKKIDIGTAKATVIGVLEPWDSNKRVFDGSFSNAIMDDGYIPYQFAIDSNFIRSKRTRCHPQAQSQWQDFVTSDVQGLMNSECTWINFWALIDNPADASRYHEFIDQYVTQQKSHGRFVRTPLNFVTNLRHFSESLMMGRRTEQLQMLAKLFFVVCLVNAIGMLLTKFLSSAKQVSLRRALGAKKKVIMVQYLLEVLMIGLFGGILGIIVAFAGLELMKRLQMYASDYQADIQALELAYQLDWQMMTTAIGTAVIATVLVGLYPIWRVINISPASQLKGL